MEYMTWGDIKSEVQKDLNIEGVPEYDEAELINMANKAINRVEAAIIRLQQDYFLTKDTIPVTAGVKIYELPSNIYASKIRRIFWLEEGYNVKRMYMATDLDDMEVQDSTLGSFTNEYKRRLRYRILNNSPTSREITLSYSDTDATMIIYYTRNANRFNINDGDSQICDIPEYADAVIAYMKYLVEYKDKSPTLPAAKQDYLEILKELTDGLAVAVNDEDTMIQPDTEIYDDHI